MRLEHFFLREWQQVSAWQILLWPVSVLFIVATSVRRTLYKKSLLPVSRQGVPIVVIGNITVGGTGKTPVVLAIAKYFRDSKLCPGIVTRGYAPATRATPISAVIHVIPTTSRKDCQNVSGLGVGDEAQLLAERSGVPVYVGRNRAQAVDTLLKQHPEVSVVFSDDGLQHYALDRDLEIAIVDGARGFGNGFLLPAGPLREPLSRLETVDCIVLNNTNIGNHLDARNPASRYHAGTLQESLAATGKPIFEMTFGNEKFISLSPGKTAVNGDNADVFFEKTRGKSIAAIAGIGNPERFFAHLARLGISLASCRAFPDHYAFAYSDISGIDADVILMTEKDAVKCREYKDERMWAMQIDVLMPDSFYEFILNKIDDVTRSKAT